MIANSNLSSNNSGNGDIDIQSSRLQLAIVAILVMVGGAYLSSQIVSDESTNPLAALLLISGILSACYAFIRPWQSFLLFLWLAVTVDTMKRLTFAVSSMSMSDVAYILAVPVILMAALYVRIFLLQWFDRDRSSIDVLQFKKFIPIFLLMLVMTAAVIGTDGLSFGNISKSYTLVCYVPAAIVVPLLLSTPERWMQFSRHLLWIGMVIGCYGLIQAWHGPFDFELTYMLSGLTGTDSLIEQDGYVRVFSLLNASGTFAGMMVICTLYSFYALCIARGKMDLKGWRIKFLILFCFTTCFFATQRGAFACGLLTIALLPLFSRPRALQAFFGLFVVLFILMIIHIDDVWNYIQDFDKYLEPIRVNNFLAENTHLLTFGARVMSFERLHEAETWTPFGIFSEHIDIMAGHDLVTNLVLWIGYVGLAVFLLMVFSLLTIASRLIQTLRPYPATYLWAQVNLAVFMYILIWGTLLGSVIHVSPLNFFFWFSIGNLLYLYQNKAVLRSDDQPEPELPGDGGPAANAALGLSRNFPNAALRA